MHEFRLAFENDVRLNKRRLIAVMLHNINDDDYVGDTEIVQQYISHFTYLPADDECFHDKLLYTMPTKKIRDEMRIQGNETDAAYGERLPLLA